MNLVALKRMSSFLLASKGHSVIDNNSKEVEEGMHCPKLDSGIGNLDAAETSGEVRHGAVEAEGCSVSARSI